MCRDCGTRLWGTPRNEAVVVVQLGTLDQPHAFKPIAHLWTRSKAPWMVIPDADVQFLTQPEDQMELVELWRSKSNNIAGRK
ncbi:GFA family protein [Comamonas serinivorans]